MIVSSKMRWAGHIARKVEMRNEYWSGSSMGREHSEDLGVDGSSCGEWGCGPFLYVSGKGTVAGCCDHCRCPSGFVKGGGCFLTS
jgi:hypothetical protein